MNTNDLALGFDPTNQSAITGAQLAQLVTSATPSSDRGMCLFTSDISGVPVIPDASTTTEWQRFIWIRYSSTTLTITGYIWNPGATYILNYNDTSTSPATPGYVNTHWTPLAVTSIPAGSITGSQIASSTIEPSNIDLAALLVALGLTPSSYLSTSSVPNTTGNISGSFGAGLTINNKNVTNAMILGGTLGTVPQVSDNTNDVVWVAPTTLGRVLKTQLYTTAAMPAQSSNAVSSVASTPKTDTVGMAQMFSSAFTKVDTTGNSKLFIEVVCQVGLRGSVAGVSAFVGLYNSAVAGTSALAGGGITALEYTSTYSSLIQSVSFAYQTGANPSNATYYIYMGCTFVGYAQLNSLDGATNPFLVTSSYIKITEYI